MFVYKHTETIEYIQKQLSFLKKYILHRKRIREFLGLRIRNFHGIISIPTQRDFQFSVSGFFKIFSRIWCSGFFNLAALYLWPKSFVTGFMR